MIICYEKSRKTVFKALQELDLLGKIKVLVLELAQPKEDQDQPITEPGFEFFQTFLNKAEDDEKVVELPNAKLDDNDSFVIFWSSGTTGKPKGIEHNIYYSKNLIHGLFSRGSKSPKFSKYLQTTCYFHVGGFISPLNSMTTPLTFIFNHGEDLDSSNLSTTELLYQEVDKYKPFLMICGSHHLVQLSIAKPKNENLDLSSVKFAMPMGSTVPATLFEQLKQTFG